MIKYENFYHINSYGYVVADLSVDYVNKTYKKSEKRRTKIANEKIKELKQLGFKEEENV